MAIFRPSHHPGPTPDSFSVPSDAPEIVAETLDFVHVAVGKSMEKVICMLQWTIQRFGNIEICLVHVHQPSHVIPTLLGNLPASKANSEVVLAYRRNEKEQMEQLLSNYLKICSRENVKASYVMVEAEQVHEGIVDLVNMLRIQKLVMGAVPGKSRRGNKKSNYTAKYAPPFCEIWCINRRKHLWTRQATPEMNFLPPVRHRENVDLENKRCKSLQDHHRYSMSLTEESLRSTSCSEARNRVNGKAVEVESVLRLTPSSSVITCDEQEEQFHLEDGRIKSESLNDHLVMKFELEAAESNDDIGSFELDRVHQIKIRKEAEDALKCILNEQEKLLEVRESVTTELQKTMRSVALLDIRAEDSKRRCLDAESEFKIIRASIANLRRESQRIQKQKIEALQWLERRKFQGNERPTGCNWVFDDTNKLAEFPLSDLETATCNFSENFKIGHGGYGCVYKGEMLGRTVAIKKLHPHSMQGKSEFQQEIEVLGKLHHPHLITLFGACPEAWSVIYEYLPNGSLHDNLFRKNTSRILTWQTRTRIILEISIALLFLHSTKPEPVVHGNLKPENILLDSKLSCKICDFGICGLVSEATLRCPSFRQYTEPKSAFPYMDPEFSRTGILTPKSDVYSFGIIILQLLTGKSSVGLACEVRKAMLSGKVEHILDSSAGEWPTFVVKRLVDLGLQCCELNGRDRPELNPVLVTELEQLHVVEERSVPSFFVCPILKEIMYDPQIAADGFTYEGEALRVWLEKGRKTSPMTNLELTHLHLTPNHALRLAIQEWLCKP